MAELDTFLEFEDALAGLVYREWEKVAEPIIEPVARAVAQADSQTAEQLINALSIDDVMQEKANRLKLIMLAAMHYGADMIEDGGSAFRNRGVPEVIPSCVAAFQGSVSYSMTKMAAQQTMITVADLVEKRTDGVYEVLKSERGVEAAVAGALLGNGDLMAKMNANLITSRLVNFGGLAQMMSMGITTYALNAIRDNKTSAVCRRMHGKQFEVRTAFDRMDRVLRITDPNELRSAAPWIPSNKAHLKMLEVASSRELAAMGFDVPPFHPACRTTVALVSQVEVTEMQYVPIKVDDAIMAVVMDLLSSKGINVPLTVEVTDELIEELFSKPDLLA